MKHRFLGAFIVFLVLGSCSMLQGQSYYLNFIPDSVYDQVDFPEFKWKGVRGFSDGKLKKSERLFGEVSWGDFFHNIEAVRNERKLNDWWVSAFIGGLIEKEFYELNISSKRLLLWFILRRMGYQVALARNSKQLRVSAVSKGVNFGYFKVKYKRKTYFEIKTPFFESKDKDLRLSCEMVLQFPPRGKRVFSYYISEYPQYEPKIKKTSIIVKSLFLNDWEPMEIPILLDVALSEMFSKYPRTSYLNTLSTPFSIDVYSGFQKSLKNALSGLTQRVQLRVLLSYFRTSIEYKADGGAKDWMLYPEEVVLKKVGDCEDKAVIFSKFVVELFDLKTILLVYNDHISVGVAFDFAGNPNKEAVIYKNELYWICDPTGPDDMYKIGVLPDGVGENESPLIFEVNP